METSLIPYSAVTHFDGKAAVVFAAHPDDETLGCGGLMAALRHEGVPVRIVLATSGGFAAPLPETETIREQESRQAAEVLGGADFIFWRETDRQLSYNERMIGRAMTAIQEAGADLLLAPSFNEVHPDHRALAWVVIEAARRLSMTGLGLQVVLYEVGAPLHRVDALVDITPWLTLKKTALQCFASQLTEQPYDDQILGLNRYRSYTLGPRVEAAEAFRVLDTQQLMQPTLLNEPEGQRQERLGLVSPVDRQARVAILIRSLDRDTLSRALDSVALQTYPNIDVHVLNVTGQAHHPVSEQAGRFRVIFHDPGNRVLRSAAANQLLDHASGDFALFLDDDDWLAPDHISRLVSALESHPEAAGAYANVEYGVLDGNAWKPETVFNSAYDQHRLRFENYLPIHSVLFRLSLIKSPDRSSSTCRFDETLDLFEDWDFWLQLTQRAPFVHIDAVSAYYLREPVSSGVFEDGQVQTENRHRLYNKWLSLLDSTAYGAFLEYVQSMYREKATLEGRVAQLDDRFIKTDQYNRDLKVLLADREEELENTRQHLASAEEILAAREKELENTRQHLASAEEILAAREKELENTRQHLASTEDILAARDTELKNLYEHADGLSQIIAERDGEITELRKPFWQKKTL